MIIHAGVLRLMLFVTSFAGFVLSAPRFWGKGLPCWLPPTPSCSTACP